MFVTCFWEEWTQKAIESFGMETQLDFVASLLYEFWKQRNQVDFFSERCTNALVIDEMFAIVMIQCKHMFDDITGLKFRTIEK